MHFFLCRSSPDSLRLRLTGPRRTLEILSCGNSSFAVQHDRPTDLVPSRARAATTSQVVRPRVFAPVNTRTTGRVLGIYKGQHHAHSSPSVRCFLLVLSFQSFLRHSSTFCPAFTFNRAPCSSSPSSLSPPLSSRSRSLVPPRPSSLLPRSRSASRRPSCTRASSARTTTSSSRPRTAVRRPASLQTGRSLALTSARRPAAMSAAPSVRFEVPAIVNPVGS